MLTKNTHMSKPKKAKSKTKQKKGVLPILGKWFLHILQGLLLGIHCLISLLQANNYCFCFISFGTII